MKNILLNSKKDYDWYRAQVNRYLSSSTVLREDMEKILSHYEVINNDFSYYEDILRSYCGINDVQSKEKITIYNRLRSKFNTLTTELKNRVDRYGVYFISDNQIKSKSEEYKQLMQMKVYEIINNILEQVEDPENEVAVNAIIEAEIKKHESDYLPYRDFKNDIELITMLLIKKEYKSQNIPDMKEKLLLHLFCTGITAIYNGEKKGKPYMKVCNSSRLRYVAEPDETDLANAEAVLYSQDYTITNFLYEFEYLTQKKDKDGKNLLENIISPYLDTFSPYNKNYTYNKFMMDYKNSTLTSPFFNTVDSTRTNIITVTHLEFKAYKQIGYLSYLNELNVQVVDLVDKSLYIPEDAQRIQYVDDDYVKRNKWVWLDERGNLVEFVVKPVLRRYEVLLANRDYLLEYREVPNQPEVTVYNDIDPKLSYKGRIINNINTEIKAPISFLLPYLFQIIAINRKIDEEIAFFSSFKKVTDIDQIPSSLPGKGMEGDAPDIDPITENQAIENATRNILFSGSKTITGQPNNQRGVGVNILPQSNAAAIADLANLDSIIDNKLGIMMGVPPQRESNIQKYTTATDNQSAIQNSLLATEMYYKVIEETILDALSEHINRLRIKIHTDKLKGNKLFSLYENVLPDYSKETLSVVSDERFLEDIGLYINNTYNDTFYKRVISNSLPTFMQSKGEGMDQLIELARLLSEDRTMNEITEAVKKMADKNRQQLQQAQEQQMQLEAQIREEEQNRELDIYRKKSQIDLERELLIKQEDNKVKIETTKIANSKFYDINNDKQNDLLELEELKHQHRMKEIAQQNATK